MNQKGQLSQYIKTQIQAGTPTATIKEQLIQHGWDASLIDEVLNEQTTVSQPASPNLPNAQPELAGQFKEQETTPNIAMEPESPNSLSVRGAFSKAILAFKANTKSIVLMAFIGTLTSVLVTILILAMGVASFSAANINILDFASGNFDILPTIMQIAPFIVIALIIILVSSAFIQSVTGLAINDGADGKKSELKRTFVAGAKRTVRVMLATVLYTVLVLAPLLMTALVGIIIGIVAENLWPVILILSLFAMVLTTIFAFTFILIPTIALFEPDMPLHKIQERSKHLMSGGGLWFVIKYALLILFINIIITALFPADTKTEDGLNIISLIGSLLQAIIFLFYSAVLIIFYRNRKALKD